PPRFFALHVFVVPGILIGCVTLHVLMVLRLGINEWPMPGRIVRRSTYLQDYHRLTQTDGAPFAPYAIWKDIVFSGVMVLGIIVCAAVFGPFGPSGPPDPTIIQTAPRPDFFFLWIYALLSYLPPAAETPVLLIAPVVVLAVLLLLPFVAGEGEKSWRRRPVAVLSVVLVAVVLGALTHLGLHTPWSPPLDAWSSEPVPDSALAGRTALQRRGAVVFQVKQCRNCHALGGRGGHRGPALDDVAVTLTYDQLVRQVIQGGGNMPAYGKNLSPAGTTALLPFLETLHPPGQPRARHRSWRGVGGRGRWAGHAAHQSLAFELRVVAGLLPFALGGVRGWVRRRRSRPLPGWRLAAWLAGLGLVWLATASPLAGL